MSRTNHKRPPSGADWWGKRPLASVVSKSQRDTKWWKRLLHKRERQQGKRQVAA